MDSEKDIFATSEGKWNFTIAIIVIVLFALIIYQFSFETTEEMAVQPIEELNGFEKESRAIISEKDSQQYLYTNSETYLPLAVQIEDAYETDKNTAVVISDIKENKLPV